MAATQRRRIREIAILKSLGSTRHRILSIYLTEFSAIGILSGVMGTLLASIGVSLLWGRLAGSVAAFPPGSVLLGTILAAAVLANLGGWAAAIPYFRRRPSELVREE